MGTFTSITDLRLRQRTRFEAVKRDINKVHKMLAEDGEEDFEDLTVGGVNSKTLKAMGHPFGRLRSGNASTGGRGIKGGGKRFKGSGIKGQINAKGVLRPLPINRQTGRLRAGIQLVGPIGSRKEYRLFSTAPYAQFVLRPGGTRFMVDRGLLGRNGMLRKRHKARIAAYVDVVRKAGRKP